MNKERMTALANLLDTVKPTQFKMSQWFGGFIDLGGGKKEWERCRVSKFSDAAQKLGSCGTTACVAGWTLVQVYPNPTDRGKAAFEVETEARQYLDLNVKEANWLFYGIWGQHPNDEIVGQGTAQEAAMAIRAMIEADGIPEEFKLI